MQSAPAIGLLPASPEQEERSGRGNRHLAAAAKKAASEEAGGEGGGGLAKTLQLDALFGLWYLLDIYFNIYNKQVLKVFPYPINITNVHFAVGTVIALFMWITGILEKPKISGAQLAATLPLAIVHIMGNLFTNMSPRKVVVSTTHPIMSNEPSFSVLSAIYLAMLPTHWVVLSLVPTVGCVALASLTEASINWAGFWSSVTSNVIFQSRNVLSKKLMVKNKISMLQKPSLLTSNKLKNSRSKESLDNINLFLIITVMSFFLLAPVTLLTEGVKVTPTVLQSAGLNLKQIYTRSFLAAFCFYASHQVSYMILGRASPVAHSVGNCIKLVVGFVTFVLFFRTSVSLNNTLVSGVALGGIFIYSQLKRLKRKAA